MEEIMLLKIIQSIHGKCRYIGVLRIVCESLSDRAGTHWQNCMNCAGASNWKLLTPNQTVGFETKLCVCFKHHFWQRRVAHVFGEGKAIISAKIAVQLYQKINADVLFNVQLEARPHLKNSKQKHSREKCERDQTKETTETLPTACAAQQHTSIS